MATDWKYYSTISELSALSSVMSRGLVSFVSTRSLDFIKRICDI